MSEFLDNFPDKTILLNQPNLKGEGVPEVNGHIHTPFSFSAFSDVEQAFSMARNENVKVLGINDFNTFDGYKEFHQLSLRYHIFPLFNVEFMGLLEKEQEKGIRINDPANPGRMYFSGKGLNYNVKLPNSLASKLEQVREESLNQTRQMLEKASHHLQTYDADLSLDFDETLAKYTRGMLRERHIAKAIRIKIYDKYTQEKEREEFLNRLFEAKGVQSSTEDVSGIENEIRGSLLKAGGPAYVKEDPKAFLPLEEIIDIIRNAGGIPCYPVLLDDSKGMYTEFEADMETLYETLLSKNIFSLELIPGRNSIEELKKFVTFFEQKNFIITFGTEHNTPDLAPIRISTRGQIPLDNYLKNVNYEGACIIAAHQYLGTKGDKTLSHIMNGITKEIKNDYIELGARVISRYIKT